MTLFDILRMNERVLVWTDEEQHVIYTWNQSLTLQAWRRKGLDAHGEWDVWEEVDLRTLSVEPSGFHGARKAAKQWANE